MARAVKTEITAMGSSSLIDVLHADARDARNLKRAINRFVKNSVRELTGPNYDEAREIAAQYIPILEQREAIAEELASAIQSGCSNLASYMGKWAILDEALRGEYTQRLRDAESKLNSLDWKEEGIDYWSIYFSCKRIIDECKDYLQKLDGLPGADTGAYSPIESLSNAIKI